MTAFDVLQHITEPKEYAKHMMDFVRLAATDEDLVISLSYVLPKGAAETIVSATNRGYPISLDGLNEEYEFTKEIDIEEKKLNGHVTVFDTLRTLTDIKLLATHMKTLVTKVNDENELVETLKLDLSEAGLQL